MSSAAKLRSLLAAGLVSTLAIVGVAMTPTAAHANALRCNSGNKSGELCLLVYNSGDTVTKAKATLSYHRYPSDHCGGSPISTYPAYMHFTLWGTRSNGTSFYQGSWAKCDTSSGGETEYIWFYPNVTFKSHTNLCLRGDFNARTSDDTHFACYYLP